MNNQSRFETFERQEQNRLDQKAYVKFKKRETYFKNMRKWTWIGSVIISLLTCYFLFDYGLHEFLKELPDSPFIDINPAPVYVVLLIIMLPINAYSIAAIISAWHMAKNIFIAIGLIGLAMSTTREGVLTTLIFFIAAISLGVMVMSYAWIPYFFLQKYLHKKDKVKYALT